MVYGYHLSLERRGFVYLASIMDLYSRKIISRTLGETLEAKWVLEVVEKAKKERRVPQPPVIHGDRGVQYTCGDYEEATEGMERSYSAKVCPWDNACIESFHSLIKNCLTHSNSLSNKMGNSLLAVRGINHKYIVVGRRCCGMKSKNVETLIQEREDLRDLLEDIMERIQEFREEMLTGLDDLEDMIAENGGMEFR